ncbi:Phospholipase A1-IIgamma [Morella rubra]|uniref:Phospholipase A1 n=1 Tax=Morella rubra TaxID=262757 RepID=A0A6A1UVN1_9ROSI|nr:Phospholipase A1-IIgamma [Morella rubra]
MANDIAANWWKLSGGEDWVGLLEPDLNLNLPRYLIHYGERVQAVVDSFIGEVKSVNCGLPRYARRHLFSKVGLVNNNPFSYEVKKYFYATTNFSVPSNFMKKSLSPKASAGDSNWIGYVAVTTDVGKTVLGRRDILIAWRGTMTFKEWVWDIIGQFVMVSASKILGTKYDPKVHLGWYSMYTAAHEGSKYNSISYRDQTHNLYKDEEVSITVTFHSMGAAMATLNVADIAHNGYNKPTDLPNKRCPVTVFGFACPRIRDKGFLKVVSDLGNLHVLCISNNTDLILRLQKSTTLTPYVDVGEELIINTLKSPYLKHLDSEHVDLTVHNLDVYLHGVAGSHGIDGDFEMEVNRDFSLVNKMTDALIDTLQITGNWWTPENKLMVQNDNGSTVLMDHERDDDDLSL